MVRQEKENGMNRTRIFTLFMFSIILFSACASGVQILRKIDPGMTPAEVENLLGRRDSFSSTNREGHIFVLHKYTNRLCNAHVSLNEKCDFFIVYRDGIVVETGVSGVRTNPSNMQFLYLFRVN
jgi:hypothetical protein